MTDKQDPAPAGARPRPVLMIPLRRCGSHALRLRLNFNPDFHSPYPLHVVDFMPIVPLYGNLEDDCAYFRLVSDVIGLQAASMVKWPGIVFDPVEIFEAIRHEPRSVHRIVWELLLRAGEQRGARVVMDKSLDSVHYADELMRLFPDMLFLNVVRDPRAQIASMNKAIIHDFDTLLNAHIWLEAHRAADMVLAEYPDRTLTIRYEDFLADEEAVLKQICAFFDIAFLPGMLDVSHSDEAKQISRMSALWSSNCFAPIAANVDKYKKVLSLEEIALIETLTHDHMRRYGYERLTDGAAAIDAPMFDTARRSSELGRTQAWQVLERTNFRDFALRRHRAEYLTSVRARMEQCAAVRASRRDGDFAPIKLDELTEAFEVTD
ncbi:sulfotransferase family protein [Trinickia acidisoli]|uniref:sulfotransferase family protein n=1 Tax=Trinickia acidisoli TaxID=2767482 RepID=UPI001A8EEC7D|nr:sulfotransferase [Trinickia acidisoli]